LLHAEVNECGLRLQLRGGLLTETEVETVPGGERRSLNMAALLSSQSFLQAFSARNRKQKSIMKNVHFRAKRIMRERFVEIVSTK
jgi:hypothetical protein